MRVKKRFAKTENAFCIFKNLNLVPLRLKKFHEKGRRLGIPIVFPLLSFPKKDNNNSNAEATKFSEMNQIMESARPNSTANQTDQQPFFMLFYTTAHIGAVGPNYK